MKKIEKRPSDLERSFHREVIILEMPDGSTEIVGSSLVRRILEEERTSEDCLQTASAT
jgi:hypothetical protein